MRSRTSLGLYLLRGAVVATMLAGCATAPPSHYGKLVFHGTVKSAAGDPVPDAIVTVRGQDALTDSAGAWQIVQEVHCHGWDQPGGLDEFEQQGGIRIAAEGYSPYVEKFGAKEAEWGKSCGGEHDLVMDAVLRRSGETVQ